MANTYSQIYIQLVFVVKRRENLIPKEHREELHKFISGIVANQEQKLLAIFCMPDHAHILVSIKPSIAISDLARDVRAGSSGFINKQKWMSNKFQWQEGFGAFSYSQSAVNNVIQYILNQEEHHRKKSFKEEYHSFLKKFEVDFEDQYLFDWIDTI